MVSQLISNN